MPWTCRRSGRTPSRPTRNPSATRSRLPRPSPAREYRCNLRTSSALLTVGRTCGSPRSTRSVRYSAGRTASVSGTLVMVASQALACTASSTRTPGTTTCGSQYGHDQTCLSTQPEYRAATSRKTAPNWSKCVIASLAGSVGYLRPGFVIVLPSLYHTARTRAHTFTDRGAEADAVGARRGEARRGRDASGYTAHAS
jgi:hypothetical protein